EAHSNEAVGEVSAMVRRYPAHGADRGVAVASALCLAASSLIAGCTDFKKSIGLEPTLPDEFAVESRAPLTIPPDFDLRPPSPGAARPQEVSAAERARKAIENAGPGEPGKQASTTLTVPQSGQGGADSELGDSSLSGKLL